MYWNWWFSETNNHTCSTQWVSGSRLWLGTSLKRLEEKKNCKFRLYVIVMQLHEVKVSASKSICKQHSHSAYTFRIKIHFVESQRVQEKVFTKCRSRKTIPKFIHVWCFQVNSIFWLPFFRGCYRIFKDI